MRSLDCRLRRAAQRAANPVNLFHANEQFRLGNLRRVKDHLSPFLDLENRRFQRIDLAVRAKSNLAPESHDVQAGQRIPHFLAVQGTCFLDGQLQDRAYRLAEAWA